jgi:uncharacterized protein (DUF433 family)
MLKKLAIGDTIIELLEAYLKIRKEDITACLFFAAESIKNDTFISKAS